MRKGVVYRKGDGLQLMESFKNETFKLIYLDPPYDCCGGQEYSFLEGEKSIRHYLAKDRKCDIGSVTKEDVEVEKKRREKNKQKDYREYITKLLENAQRLLTDDGILCFLAPSTRYTDINFQFMLDQLFGKSMSVTIEKAARPNFTRAATSNSDVLYFYSKKSDFVFTKLLELADITNFPYQDDFDNYRLVPCEQKSRACGEKYIFDWNGILPKGAWRYTKEKMEELDAQNRLEIKNKRVFLKVYRTEHPVEVSSVWKNEGYPFYSISESNMRRMFSLFVNENDMVLAPFERDGVFPYVANDLGLRWCILHQTNLSERIDRLNDVNSFDYEEKEIENCNRVAYTAKIITNAEEAKEIQERLQQLSSTIEELQESLDIDAEDDVVEAVIDKMHEKIVEAVSSYSLESCYPEAEAWLFPYWENLEEESKLFIPTGLFLYKQLRGNKKADVAAVLLEYCKSLEREMFQKMFKGYISTLVDNQIDVAVVYEEAFRKDVTRIFAEFLLKCTTDYRDDDSKWKFEMGKCDLSCKWHYLKRKIRML